MSKTAVERSVNGRRWCWRAHDPALALAISQRLDLPEIVGRVLAGRGIGLDQVPGFIAPRLKDALPDPSHLLDLDRAAERIVEAIEGREPIGLLADYDVDGATSAAVMARYLRAVGAQFAIDIPDRLAEGYGPNPTALARLAAEDCRLVVTLDAGTTAFEALTSAAEAGQEVIVVDHHVAEARLPPAFAVINPNRRDQDSPLGELAAVGVTFVLVIALNRRLRARGWFDERAEPDLRQWLDLVALGTVCDVVPLRGLNRSFVAQGLKVAARQGNPGLAALAAIAAIKGDPTVEHFGFALGPRLNAGGRTGFSALGAELLTSDQPDVVTRIAAQLDGLNHERRRLERDVLAAAEAQLDAALAADAPVLVAAGNDWSPGVVGVAASRLVDRHQRPALVIGISDGIGKGSGRSVPGFDLGDAIIAARQHGILQQGGGHPMAAGFTVAVDQLPQLEALLAARFEEARGVGPPPAPDLDLDGAIQLSGLSLGLAERLAALAPFGQGNPAPRFMLPGVRTIRPRSLNGGHVDCLLTDPGGGKRVRAIAFRAAERPLGRTLLESTDTPLHVAGTLKVDEWQGNRRVSFEIQDAAAV